MNLTKDKKKGTWYVQFYYTDWQGNRKKKFKRGFKTKSEAQEWAMNFLQRQKGDTSLMFGQFIDEYYEDMEKRLKGNTMKTKKYIIEFKIRPFFANKVLSEITPLDIRKWQNELLDKGYKQTYLKTVNNQLSAMFNYAVNFRGLPSNPCRKAGTIGKSKADEMKFWTLDEYKIFIEGAKDKEMSYMAFQMLYWTGMVKYHYIYGC
ncbi:MAG: tyrosine-type recombinase/integrase [Eubacterium ventriosum]